MGEEEVMVEEEVEVMEEEVDMEEEEEVDMEEEVVAMEGATEVVVMVVEGLSRTHKDSLLLECLLVWVEKEE